MLFESCFYSLNLVLYVFFVFFLKEPNVFFKFSLFFLFFRVKNDF